MGKKLNLLLSENEGKDINISIYTTSFGSFLNCDVFVTIGDTNFVGNYKPSGVNSLLDYLGQVNLEEVAGATAKGDKR